MPNTVVFLSGATGGSGARLAFFHRQDGGGPVAVDGEFPMRRDELRLEIEIHGIENLNGPDVLESHFQGNLIRVKIIARPNNVKLVAVKIAYVSGELAQRHGSGVTINVGLFPRDIVPRLQCGVIGDKILE
jgi:hypothetical protein